MKKIDFKKLLPHVSAIVLFLIITMVYLSPTFEGKILNRHDNNVYKGTAREANEFRKETGEKTLWTNSMFGGMPTYLTNSERGVIINKIHHTIKVFKNEPLAQVFLYLIGFYFTLLAFGVNAWLAILGAIAFAFSSYFFIIIQAGHATKAFAIAYMGPIIAGLYYSFNKKPLAGAVIMSLFLAIQINANHYQISYYTGIVCLIFGIAWFIDALKKKKIISFVKPLMLNIVGVLFAILINITGIYHTYDYGKYSIRGASELTDSNNNQTSGLDKDYATAWSYGIDETFTLLVPNFKGGASGGSLDTNSETYKLFEQAQGKVQAKKVIKQLPLYWGTQPFTSGPVYVGAIICFLFVLGLFVIKGPMKWWLLSATVLSVLLAWGKNFMPLTDLFLDYFPGYNKFRAVSTILVIAEFTMPLLGILALKEVFSGNVEKKKFNKSLYWSLGITAGLSLIFGLFAGGFSYQAVGDAGMQPVLVDALQTDRQMLLRSDAFRSFFLIMIAGILIWTGFNNKLDKKYLYPLLIVLVLGDMWTINKRYLNENHFVTKKTYKNTFTPTKADEYILKDMDPNFRVLNLSVSTFNDATTSTFHKSIGGYHGAKMRRYQELIDKYIGREMQTTISKLQAKGGNVDYYGAVAANPILNMLNTKYFIINPESFPIVNTAAMGNAWFVKDIKAVENANEEIDALGKINLKTTAVYDKKFADKITDENIQYDSTATITFEDYKPNYLKYSTKANGNQVAIFSEIYYPKGWVAFIDGEEAPYFRANYTLRAMSIPAGEHTIEWKFEPKSYAITTTVSSVSTIILLLLALGLLAQSFIKKPENE